MKKQTSACLSEKSVRATRDVIARVPPVRSKYSEEVRTVIYGTPCARLHGFYLRILRERRRCLYRLSIFKGLRSRPVLKFAPLRKPRARIGYDLPRFRAATLISIRSTFTSRVINEHSAFSHEACDYIDSICIKKIKNLLLYEMIKRGYASCRIDANEFF